jgi:histidyl-tRNA synthetase
MSQKLQSIRGMNDILPPESALWGRLERAFSLLMHQYGFHEVRTPILEKTELFIRSIGEVTDIVEKEMYTFADRNNESLTLRPEGTASVVRALIQHGLTQERSKFWYRGPMFRYEKPQKERYRQFHQMGCETFGFVGPDIDAELIALTARLWNVLGLTQVELQLNSLGSSEERQEYRDELVAYLNDHRAQLDEDSLRRLDSNPLRILDSKNPDMHSLIAAAPKLLDQLGGASREHFESLCGLLEAMNIRYTVNKTLVRGLDYYNKTVFEWVTTELGAQGTICAGGRYDGLVEQLGNKCPTPAVGFALGVERVVALMQLHQEDTTSRPDVAVITDNSDAAVRIAFGLTEQLRDQFPKRVMVNPLGGGKFKAQFKRAADSGARFALVIGEKELENDSIALKNLDSQQQSEVKLSDIMTTLATALS